MRTREARWAWVRIVILAALAACAYSDPKTEFLLAWLEEHAPRLNVSDRSRVVDALLDSEESHGIDALLLLAVMEEESRYDPRARSRKGARGLMQLRPETAREVADRHGWSWDGEDGLEHPATSVRLGAAYLATLKSSFGSWERALAAYNYGPRRIRRIEARGGKIPAAYVGRVRDRHGRIRDAYRQLDLAPPS